MSNPSSSFPKFLYITFLLLALSQSFEIQVSTVNYFCDQILYESSDVVYCGIYQTQTTPVYPYYGFNTTNPKNISYFKAYFASSCGGYPSVNSNGGVFCLAYNSNTTLLNFVNLLNDTVLSSLDIGIWGSNLIVGDYLVVYNMSATENITSGVIYDTLTQQSSCNFSANFGEYTTLGLQNVFFDNDTNIAIFIANQNTTDNTDLIMGYNCSSESVIFNNTFDNTINPIPYNKNWSFEMLYDDQTVFLLTNGVGFVMFSNGVATILFENDSLAIQYFAQYNSTDIFFSTMAGEISHYQLNSTTSLALINRITVPFQTSVIQIIEYQNSSALKVSSTTYNYWILDIETFDILQVTPFYPYPPLNNGSTLQISYGAISIINLNTTQHYETPFSTLTGRDSLYFLPPYTDFWTMKSNNNASDPQFWILNVNLETNSIVEFQIPSSYQYYGSFQILAATNDSRGLQFAIQQSDENSDVSMLVYSGGQFSNMSYEDGDFMFFNNTTPVILIAPNSFKLTEELFATIYGDNQLAVINITNSRATQNIKIQLDLNSIGTVSKLIPTQMNDNFYIYGWVLYVGNDVFFMNHAGETLNISGVGYQFYYTISVGNSSYFTSDFVVYEYAVTNWSSPYVPYEPSSNFYEVVLIGLGIVAVMLVVGILGQKICQKRKRKMSQNINDTSNYRNDASNIRRDSADYRGLE